MSDRESKLQGELEELRRDFQDFCYRVSHDLQGSLRNVGGFLSLIEGRAHACFDDKSRQYLGFVKQGAEQAQSILNGLSEYSYLLAEERNFGSVYLGDVLETVLKELAPEIKGRRASIGKKLCAVDIFGDPLLLHKALKQVLLNSLVYSKNAPKISITFEKKNAQYLVTVQDEGVGIPKDQKKKVFEPFERLHTQDQYPGIGLGLTVAKRAIELHGGRIWIEPDEEEIGTTVYMTFPLKA